MSSARFFSIAALLRSIDPVMPQDCVLHAAPLSHGSGLYGLPHVARGAVSVVPQSGGVDGDEIAGLRAKQDEARTKLASLRNAGEGAWEDLKAGVEMARDAIGEAIKSAKSRFNK